MSEAGNYSKAYRIENEHVEIEMAILGTVKIKNDKVSPERIIMPAIAAMLAKFQKEMEDEVTI
jgi:hypothetical protein